MLCPSPRVTLGDFRLDKYLGKSTISKKKIINKYINLACIKLCTAGINWNNQTPPVFGQTLLISTLNSKTVLSFFFRDDIIMKSWEYKP
jgi:hypothetical protein